jgi:ribosomal-protein-alanine N-acetyltransferase
MLRPLAPPDAAELMRFHSDNATHLQEWMPAPSPRAHEVSYWKERILQAQELQRLHRAVRFGIFLREQPKRLIGQANLNDVVRGSAHYCTLGYMLAKEAEGKGLMTEALREVLRFAFDELRLHRVLACYIPRNERSGRVLAGLGFEREGFARDYLLINGKWEDHILTGIINPNWQP